MNIDYNQRRNEQKSSHSCHPSVRFRNRFIIHQLKNIKFETLIDIGCGDGHLLRLIQGYFPDKQYAGLDISDEIISQNKEKYKGIKFRQGDLGLDINPKEKYDVVVCSEVIEHISAREQVVKNLSSLVDERGILILTTQSGKRYKSDINIGHLKHFMLSELESKCKENGLKILESYKKGFPFYNMQKRLYERIEEKAKKVQQSETNLITKIIFNITYFLFLLSIRSRVLGPQIFMVLQKN